VVGIVVGIVAIISGPSLILASIKLRKRNLGPILDGNGWAINSQAKINVPFGATLTQVAKIPVSAHRNLIDPFAQKRSPLPAILLTGLMLYLSYAALDHFGLVYKYTKGFIGRNHESVKGR
jgi:hypothetical protein